MIRCVAGSSAALIFTADWGGIRVCFRCSASTQREGDPDLFNRAGGTRRDLQAQHRSGLDTCGNTADHGGDEEVGVS